jgi:hypothetical protein
MRSENGKLKIGIFSRQCDTPHCREQVESIEFYFRLISSAAQEASKANCDVLILPLHSLGKQNELIHYKNQRAISKAKELFKSLAQEHQITILGEIDGTYWFYPNQTVSHIMEQCFAFSGDDLSEKQKFMLEFNSDQRTTNMNGVRTKVMICGENNILTSHRNGLFSMPEQLNWSWDYDLLLNPTHDSATRPELWNRYEYWSKEGRTVIHTTNNFRKNSWQTAIRVYRDGQLIADAANASHLVKGEKWRMIIMNIPQ